MKTLNTISNKIQSLIANFIAKKATSAKAENIQNEENILLNDTEAILFQINKQEDEFLFI
ncbi:MAG: hypothetical protein V4548_13175 [Bacteroidota bacterium]